MEVEQSPLEGVLLCRLQSHGDERGLFVNLWDRSPMEGPFGGAALDKCNLSQNPRRGTLRGMHWQEEPHGEHKLITCVSGEVFDVLVDVRPGKTHLQWWGTRLASPSVALYVPPGFAHGYLTLTDDAGVLYNMSGNYQPASARGLRYDDPAVGILWPEPVSLISERDASYPLLSPT